MTVDPDRCGSNVGVGQVDNSRFGPTCIELFQIRIDCIRYCSNLGGASIDPNGPSSNHLGFK